MIALTCVRYALCVVHHITTFLSLSIPFLLFFSQYLCPNLLQILTTVYTPFCTSFYTSFLPHFNPYISYFTTLHIFLVGDGSDFLSCLFHHAAWPDLVLCLYFFSGGIGCYACCGNSMGIVYHSGLHFLRHRGLEKLVVFSLGIQHFQSGSHVKFFFFSVPSF